MQNENDFTLSVIYDTEGETKNDSILVIRPSNTDIEESEVCLRQLIALTAHDYEIRLQSEQEYIGNEIGLLVRLKDTKNDNVTWNFQKDTFTFLTAHNKNNKDAVKDQWKQIQPAQTLFTIDIDKIHFSGLTSE